MLGNDFLRSLGIKEELLPSVESAPAVALADNDQTTLPMAREYGIPTELLELQTDELEKMLKEEYTQENPYVYMFSINNLKVAVYPKETLGKKNLYILEYTADEFISNVKELKNNKLHPIRISLMLSDIDRRNFNYKLERLKQQNMKIMKFNGHINK